MRWLRTVWLAVVVLSSGLVWQAWADDAPPPRHLWVNGVELSYIEQGTGAPVVFVHGAGGDLRAWEPQRQAIAPQYRFMAYNHRYHGTAPWPDEGQHYSAATHAADLAAFIRQLDASPVHLVASSYGGLLATVVASEHADLVRSLTLLEPAIGALLADSPEAKPVRDEWRNAFEPIRTAAKNRGYRTGYQVVV
jgi:pimeloyl-ACP methyl ester carboxylesterase